MKTYKILIITADATRVEIKGVFENANVILTAIETLWPNAKRVDVLIIGEVKP